VHTAESEQEDADQVHSELIQKKKEAMKGKKPRASVSAEVFGEWNKKGQFEAKVFEKTAETAASLKELLRKCFMFRYLSFKEMKVVIAAMEKQEALAGE
jgi:cAMP-dependent protein kinase regulator